MKDNRTELQKEFEAQTPTIKGVCKIEYLQTFVSWLHLQVDRARGQELHLASVDSRRELLVADISKVNQPIITLLEIADYERAADYLLGKL